MKKKILKNNIEKEFKNAESLPSVNICIKDFFMEAGFQSGCTAEEKYLFYKGTAKLVSYVNTIAEILNENTVYVGSFVKGEKNYYKWKDIKNFDAYNELHEKLNSKEIKQINITDSNMLDLIMECNLRYFSKVMLFFPKSKIFIRPDVHCYLEIYGNKSRLDSLTQKISSAMATEEEFYLNRRETTP